MFVLAPTLFLELLLSEQPLAQVFVLPPALLVERLVAHLASPPLLAVRECEYLAGVLTVLEPHDGQQHDPAIRHRAERDNADRALAEPLWHLNQPTRCRGI